MDNNGEPRRPDTAGAEGTTAEDDSDQAGWAAPPRLRRQWPTQTPTAPPGQWPAQTPPAPPGQWPTQTPPAPPGQWPSQTPTPPAPAQWQPPRQWQPPAQTAIPWTGQTQSNWAGQAHQPPPVSEETESDERGDPDQKRRRVMIGGAATVGIVSLISIGFSAMGDDVVVARCIDDRNVVMDEANCPDPGRASSTAGSGGYGPSPLLGGARQYHYTYGGSGDYGEIAAGGGNVMPKRVTIVTLSGRTLVQRGGFGQTSSRSSGS